MIRNISIRFKNIKYLKTFFYKITLRLLTQNFVSWIYIKIEIIHNTAKVNQILS